MSSAEWKHLKEHAKSAAQWFSFRTKNGFVDSVRKYLVDHNDYSNPYIREQDVSELAQEIYYEVNDVEEGLKVSFYISDKEQDASGLKKLYWKIQAILYKSWKLIHKSLFYLALSLMCITFLIFIIVSLQHGKLPNVIRELSDLFYESYETLRKIFYNIVKNIIDMDLENFLESVSKSLHEYKNFYASFSNKLRKLNLYKLYNILMLSIGLMIVVIIMWFVNLRKRWVDVIDI